MKREGMERDNKRKREVENKGEKARCKVNEKDSVKTKAIALTEKNCPPSNIAVKVENVPMERQEKCVDAICEEEIVETVEDGEGRRQCDQCKSLCEEKHNYCGFCGAKISHLSDHISFESSVGEQGHELCNGTKTHDFYQELFYARDLSSSEIRTSDCALPPLTLESRILLTKNEECRYWFVCKFPSHLGKDFWLGDCLLTYVSKPLSEIIGMKSTASPLSSILCKELTLQYKRMTEELLSLLRPSPSYHASLVIKTVLQSSSGHLYGATQEALLFINANRMVDVAFFFITKIWKIDSVSEAPNLL